MTAEQGAADGPRAKGMEPKGPGMGRASGGDDVEPGLGDRTAAGTTRARGTAAEHGWSMSTSRICGSAFGTGAGVPLSLVTTLKGCVMTVSPGFARAILVSIGATRREKRAWLSP